MPWRRAHRFAKGFCLLLGAMVVLGGCYALRGSSGAGETSFEGTRPLDPADIALPAGYRVEAVAGGLTFPTGVAFDDGGGVDVTEAGYSYGEVWTTPRLLRVEPDGAVTTVAAGSRNGPWNGVTHHEESSQGRWAKRPSVDGKGRIEYVAQPPAMGEVPELGVVDPRLQGTPKKPHKPRA